MSRSVTESSLPTSGVSPDSGDEHTHQRLAFLPTNYDEGFCPLSGAMSDKTETHPASAGTSLKCHPLSLGSPELFHDVWKDLTILSVKTCMFFLLYKCKLAFAGYH